MKKRIYLVLTKHLRTRLGHRKPHAVHSVAVFCDFKSVLLLTTDVSPLIPITIIGYVQSQSTESSTAHAMTEWFPDATWAPVPGGLADHPDFLLYISLAEKTAAPWFKLSVFGELRSSNGGLLAAGENRKVFANPLIHCLALPSDWTMCILVQLAAEAARAERRAHRKAV